MASELATVAVGIGAGDVDHGVREEGGQNRGPRVKKYLANTNPPINVAAPWCAAWVQYVVDQAAELLRVPNPLDEVKLEAYVQSYHEWAEKGGRFVVPERAERGDLVLFSFGGQRFDHIGLLLDPPDPAGKFRSIEGNTNKAGEREGDGVSIKDRSARASYPVKFVRWVA